MNNALKMTITAHTGCMNTKANSIESIEKGFAVGADIVEIDIRFDADGVPVLSHNELSPDDEKNAVRLADAFDVIKKYPNKKVNLDIKDVSHIDAVVTLAQSKGVAQQVFFTGIWKRFLPAVKHFDNIPYYLNFNPRSAFCRFMPYIRRLVKMTKKSGAMGLNLNKKGCSEKLVDAFHQAGLAVSIWTVTNAEDAKKYIAMVPDNITCKNPDELLALLSLENI